MTDKIRIGCIGVGQIGKHHLENYSKIQGAELVALADINETELNRVGDLTGIHNRYTDFKKMLERDDIQAVDVCLHNNLHMPVTVAALEAGKHVFCEKPMAGSYIDAETMFTKAQELDLKLAIQSRLLFEVETRAARSIIDQGLLGKRYHARSLGFRRRGRPFVDGYGTPTFVQKENSSGGALYDMGVYNIIQILYLLDNPNPLRISGKIYQETDMDPRRREISGYNVEELGMGFVRLEGDVTLDIIESWAIYLDGFEGSYVVGSQGGVRLSPFGFFHSAGDLSFNSTANLDEFNYRLHNIHEQGDIYDSPQHHWVAALQGRVALLPSAKLALNTMLISEGIYLSSKLGREVSAEEIRAASTSSAIKV
ncbi:MAG: Gfo/Idh/MocA family oxidoreductase [Anaerolineales bacterium]|nr:Gfo/Idh/MocA family oxidoreductase [Anaerolineales bacterium]